MVFKVFPIRKRTDLYQVLSADIQNNPVKNQNIPTIVFYMTLLLVH